MKDYWSMSLGTVKSYRTGVAYNDAAAVDDPALYEFGTADIRVLLEIIEYQARALENLEETIRMGYRCTSTKAEQRRWRRLAEAARGEKIKWDCPL